MADSTTQQTTQQTGAPLFTNPEPKVETPPAAEPTPPAEEGTTILTEPDKSKTPSEPQDKTTEKKPEPNPLLGAPAEGKYEAFKLPDGYVADEAIMTDFGKTAAEIGLSQAGAQKIVDLYNQMTAKQGEAWVTEVKGWADKAKADKEIGGANYDANIKLARSAIEKFGSPALVEQLNFSGFGNHPEFIRFAYKVGQALSEATVAGGGTPGAEPKTAAEILFGGTS